MWHVNHPTGQKMGYACFSEQLIRLYIQKIDKKFPYWYETGILKCRMGRKYFLANFVAL